MVRKNIQPGVLCYTQSNTVKQWEPPAVSSNCVDMRILFSYRYYLLILPPPFSSYQSPVNGVLWQYSQVGQSSFHHAHAATLLATSYPATCVSDYFNLGWDSGSHDTLIQPVWVSHLPGLFSDAQIGLLITNFLLLFVTCCVVGGGIVRLSVYQVTKVR